MGIEQTRVVPPRRPTGLGRRPGRVPELAKRRERISRRRGDHAACTRPSRRFFF